MKNVKDIISKVFLVSSFFFLFNETLKSQLSYESFEPENFISTIDEHVSLIAYKLPFRGENYKFYGTFSYHIYGRAYADCKVHNAIVESFHLSEQNCRGANFKLLKSSKRKAGKLLPFNSTKNGKFADFMTPLKKKGIPIKHYFRTGLFRLFIKFDKEGKSKLNNHISVDFDNLAQYIINLDDAAKIYNLRIKKIIFNRFLLDELFSCRSGAELKSRNIYFAKFLSDKVNRRYDDLFYVEFEEID